MKISPITLSAAAVFAVVSIACKVHEQAESISVGQAVAKPPANWTELAKDFELQSACAKQDFLWNTRVLPTVYESNKLPRLEGVGGLSLIWGAMLKKLGTKMDYLGDQAPDGWKKPLHRRSVLAKTQFIASENSPFSGLFQGAPCGFLRLSLTADPGNDEYNPGLAWKAFIDGKPSANISALVSLDGQGDNFNFFANEFSNIVPASDKLKLKIAARAFRTTSKHPHKIGTQGFAEFTRSGQVPENIHHPVRIFFVPDPSLSKRTPAQPARDFRPELMNESMFTEGTPLFHLYAVNEPNHNSVTAEDIDKAVDDAALRARAIKIGTLVGNSGFKASLWGDDGIFFNHRRFRDE